MALKLVAVIAVDGIGYGLYTGNKGPAWFGPEGPVLDRMHEVQASYEVNGPRVELVPEAETGYQANLLAGMVRYMAAYFKADIIKLPPEPRTRPGRVY